MPTRSYVQVAVDGAGKKIANVAVTEPSPPDTSGNATADTTTYQQLTTATDDRGDIVAAPWDAVLIELRAITGALERISAQLE